MSEPTNTDEPVTTHADAPGPKGDAATGVHDRVVMASRRANGDHAQSDDFEFIGPKDGVIDGAKHQFVSAAYAGLQTSTDPDVNPTTEEQESARKDAEAKAEAEVNERHKGAFDS